jgi:hypothetical protein
MDRMQLNTLIVNDDDMECQKDKSEITLDDIKLSKVGFIAEDLAKYDAIIYKGKYGIKLLKIK